MAIEIKFTGFVNEVKKFDWATVLKVAHNQVKKTPDGKWETVSRDYFDVIVPTDSNFIDGDRIDVVGKLKTKLYDKKDGSKGIALEVRGDDVRKSGASSVPSAPVSVPDSWSQIPADTDLPF
jgi:hypothetical protein